MRNKTVREKITEIVEKVPLAECFDISAVRACGSSQTVYQTLSDLAKAGVIVRLRKGTYRRAANPSPLAVLPESILVRVPPGMREALAIAGKALSAKTGQDLSINKVAIEAFERLIRTEAPEALQKIRG